MTEKQLRLPYQYNNQETNFENYYDVLKSLLSSDLDFHEKSSQYATHGIHSFPAKFPPQIPRKFIIGLTNIGDIILDPMCGSGTTILESMLLDRRGIGFDIDPLALLMSKVKVSCYEKSLLISNGQKIVKNSAQSVKNNSNQIEAELLDFFDEKTKDFVDYWFATETQIELLALIKEINLIENVVVRDFFKLVFSSIIITKSGGVSLAFDLGHTRPHRAKIAYSQNGDLLIGHEYINDPSPRVKFLTKHVKPAIVEFDNKYQSLTNTQNNQISDSLIPFIEFGNAENLPLEEETVDLVVTSPPYASNAIDYMRAHKFSLVWFGHQINDLSIKRRDYIGAEYTTDFQMESLPEICDDVIKKLSSKKPRKGAVLQRYYSEMVRSLREIYRVLKPGKAAIFVVGNSILGGIDTNIPECLLDIASMVGFSRQVIGVRNLDRNRRMLPFGNNGQDSKSQIQQRMNEEYVLGFFKS